MTYLGKKITAILAMTPDGIVGRNGKLPWHLSEDLRHFKKTTLGNTIVVGRKTWESFGSKPLPGRNTIVLSRSGEERVEMFGDDKVYFSSTPKILDVVEPRGDFFIAGGAEIYELFSDVTDEWIVSLVSRELLPHPEPEDTRVHFTVRSLERIKDERIRFYSQFSIGKYTMNKAA